MSSNRSWSRLLYSSEETLGGEGGRAGGRRWLRRWGGIKLKNRVDISSVELGRKENWDCTGGGRGGGGGRVR